MSHFTLAQSSRLNDTMEQSLLHATRSAADTPAAGAMVKRVFTTLRRAGAAFLEFMIDASEELNRARSLSEKYTRSHW